MPLARRLNELRTILEASNLDAMLVSFLPNIRYLTGFSGSNALCIVTMDRRYFLSDGRYRDQARAEIRGFRVFITSRGLIEEASRLNLLKGSKRVGIESQHLPVATLQNLRRHFRSVRFVSTRSLVENIAAIKDEQEIDLIRHAVAITDKVFKKILSVVKPGLSELDLAAEIGYYHRKFGAEAEAFETIVASGPHGAFPHARPTERRIRRGDLVTLDFGCRFRGYHSDLTRTIAVGNPSPLARRIYAIVLDAQLRAIEAARSGVAAKEVDGVARKHIKRNGFGKYFNHSLGHGLGLQIHETLRLSALSKDVLRSGNVVTVEPGIYIPGVGGVRIEDDVVIRDGHCDILNTSTKELIVL